MRLFSSVPLRHVHEKRQSPQETVSKSLEWNVVSEIQIAEIILKPDLSIAMQGRKQVQPSGDIRFGHAPQQSFRGTCQGRPSGI